MAIRLSKAFGSTPEIWIGTRITYNIWQLRNRPGDIVVELFCGNVKPSNKKIYPCH